eukprot:757370-Hanusia_phi.AAC.3
MRVSELASGGRGRTGRRGYDAVSVNGPGSFPGMTLGRRRRGDDKGQVTWSQGIAVGTTSALSHALMGQVRGREGRGDMVSLATAGEDSGTDSSERDDAARENLSSTDDGRQRGHAEPRSLLVGECTRGQENEA